MLKRTKGRFLLTVLVITGLAGTLKNSSLTSQERKLVINELKDSKSELLKSIKGLSEQQLNYKPSRERWSIKECIYHVTMAEKGLWETFATTMKEPSVPVKPATLLSDEDVVNIATDRVHKLIAPESLQPVKAPWKTANEAISAFKIIRMEHVKYAKLTTEDLRDHFMPLAFGKIDGYQFLLFMSAHCNRHIQQINEIKADPGFPKK